ncbi:MAG: MarR family transcriptional regulator [Streptosporangiales bacterium]|nr:MarR family transcriptional regulator [Streptosporangiales bacterium]
MYIVGVMTETRPVEALADDLIALSARLVRMVGAMADVSMSATQSRVLARLRDGGPLRVTELARHEHCTQPSMTAAVDRLERAGLVVRRGDADDGRAVLVAVTDEGVRRLSVARASMAAVLVPSIERLSPSERDQLVAHADILRTLMEDPTS